MKRDESFYRSTSLWFDELDAPVTPRAALEGAEQADVAIVGAGYSGLWTAYYLARSRPELRIAIVEGEVAGYGASGRNGGWCVGDVSGADALLARRSTRAAGLDLQRAAFAAVDEIGRVCSEEGIDAHYKKGGVLRIAANPTQGEQLREHVSRLAHFGFEPSDYLFLEPDEVAERFRGIETYGAMLGAHCAVLQPARLVRGLADRVEALGVRIFEDSPVTHIAPRAIRTAGGELRAEQVVVATEGFTSLLKGRHRDLLTLHSWMLATEPLPESVWKEIGLDEREAFSDASLSVTYAQRTVDDRLAFGAWGTYNFGSRVQHRFDRSEPLFAELHRMMLKLFPALTDAEITHHWGGPIAAARDLRTRVGFDPESGMGWIGGYIGEGVAISNLAGHTLAELLAGLDTERTRLALVSPPARKWEIEPLRWLAVTSLIGAAGAVDRAGAGGWTSRLAARAFRAVTGR